MPRLVRALLVALAGAAALAVLLVIAWGLDLRAHDGEAVRNVTLAGEPVGGLSRDELAPVVASVAARFDGAPVQVRAPGGGFATDTTALGVRVDEAATVTAVLDAGRTGSVPGRLWRWLGAAVAGDQAAPVRVAVDEAAVWRVVRELDPGTRDEPVEPSVAYREGAFVAVPGSPGKGIDPREVVESLPYAAEDGLPLAVDVGRGPVPPRWPVAEAERLAGLAQATVDEPLRVEAGGENAEIPVDRQQAWVTTKAADDGLHLAVDAGTVLADLEKALEAAGRKPVETRFTVEGGQVRIIAGEPGTACCEASAATAVERALFEPERPVVEVDLRERPPELTVDEAKRLGVKEPIASATTQHKCCEGRVKNIQRIADLVRGQVIEPGGTFSVNGFVGRRTTAKGFVSAGVIENGVFTEDVGGGISQFATTLFNAAFFGGLEFEEYQSHSIYISRYPYGREATLSYPRPDLKIHNPSPHGVMIWPTYTATSITVTLYSTPWATGEQTGQSTAPRGNCTRVTTERTRTWLEDGRTEVDRVYATYRPEEGVNC